MPEKTLQPTQKVSHSLGIAFGVTEIIFLLGLLLLAAGIVLLFGFAWGFVAVGGILLFTSFWNAREREKGS